MPDSMLSVENVCASVDNKLILNEVSFSVGKGEIHVLMGPNGSGKSTLAHVIMGDPKIALTSGTVRFFNEDISAMSPDARAKKGLFVGFQYPVEIPDVGQMAFMRSVFASNAMPLVSVDAFCAQVVPVLERVGLAPHFLDRNVNQGFSGGEKKRNEMFQLSVFNPQMAIMDEIDSGLDVDGTRMVAEELRTFADAGKSVLLITHLGTVAQALVPDAVYIMKGGRIVKCGGKDLMEFVEAHGFENI